MASSLASAVPLGPFYKRLPITTPAQAPSPTNLRLSNSSQHIRTFTLPFALDSAPRDHDSPTMAPSRALLPRASPRLRRPSLRPCAPGLVPARAATNSSIRSNLTGPVPSPAPPPRAPWRALSPAGRLGRATAQTGNLGVVLVGAVLTAGIGYLLLTQVVAAEGPVALFDRAADEVRGDARVQELLGAARKGKRGVRAHGEETGSRWVRNRPVATSVRRTGRGEAEECVMRFYVSAGCCGAAGGELMGAG